MSTVVIDPQIELTTSVTVFTVDPADQRTLLGLLVSATEELIRHKPGFISASAHVSVDGTRIVNYVQWETVEAVRAMLADPTCRERMAAAKVIGQSEAKHYTVASAIRGG
jgi:quinol monooxygenase YgiN